MLQKAAPTLSATDPQKTPQSLLAMVPVIPQGLLLSLRRTGLALSHIC